MKVNENYYECKLVSMGEQADATIKKLRDKNLMLTTLLDEKNNNIPEDYKHDLKVYKSRVENLERTCSVLKETIKSKDHYLDKLSTKLDCLKNRNALLENLYRQHRYVFSEIPNTEENMKMVKLMKKHINKERYNLRWRGQYLDDKTKETEGWKPYSDGQPLSKSKCIRVYIDSKGSDTTEGFNLQEIDLILDGLYYREDKCHEIIDNWGYKGNEKDEDVVNEKSTLKKTLSLQKYFEEMKVHLEECQSKMGETNNVT